MPSPLAAPGMPTCVPPMRAVVGDLPTDDGRWSYEVKWDGVRAIGFVAGGKLRLQSSNLLNITVRYPELAPLAAELDGQAVVLDGEIVTFNEHGRPDFGLLQNRMHLTGDRVIAEWAVRQPVVWAIFDVLHVNGHDLFVPGPDDVSRATRQARRADAQQFTYENRRRLLGQLIETGPHWNVPAAHTEDGAGLLAAMDARGMEGVVAKRLDSIYEAGRRSAAWRKVKVRRGQEFVVGGWRGGEGHRSGAIGSLLVGYYTEDGRFTYAGRVGSGLTQAEIAHLERAFTATRRDTCPFDPPPSRDEQRGATWVEPRVVVDVRFGEWSRDNRLRHPSYLGRRSDKDPRDVVREPG